MGCNSSNQVGSTPPNTNLPSKQRQTEAQQKKAQEAEATAAATPDVVAAKAAFEAALEEANEDQDKVVALAEAYSNCYATALLKTPGSLPPEGFYTKAESIFDALMPRGDGGIAPVKLLSSKWIKDRAAKLKKATTDEERRKLRLPRRQDLERDEPEAFMSVERLKELPRKHGSRGTERLQAAASSYCWLTPAHPDPLGEQLVSLAEAIKRAEREGEWYQHFPSEAAIFVDFGSLCQKDSDLWVPCCGGPTYKPPEARTAEEAAAADAYEASRTGEEREAFGVALSSMQIWYVHPLLTAFLTRTLPEGYESIAGYEEVRHALANSTLTPSLPTHSTALFPQRGWPTCESSWVALAKEAVPYCFPPIFDVVGSRRTIRIERREGSFGISVGQNRVGRLDPGCSAIDAGIKEGDKICSVDGVAIRSYGEFPREIHGKEQIELVVDMPYRRPAPLSPAAMARLVARKRFTSKKGDLPMVIALNTRTILSIFRDMKELKYLSVGWGDDEAVQLAEVLPLCTSATVLDLRINKISDGGAKALAAAFAEGALPKLKDLHLEDNQIGDEGAKALAEAVGKGALPELKDLHLEDNQIGDDGAVALAEAVGKGAMPELTYLALYNNKLSQTAKDACKAVEAKRGGLFVRTDWI